MRVKLYVETGYVGCDYDEYIDVPDDTPEDELNDMAHELMLDNINWGFITEHQARKYGIEDFEFKMMDRYFYAIEPDMDCGKVVHFLINIYRNDDGDYKIAEWCGEYMSIQSVKNLLKDDYLFYYINERIRYLGDLTQSEAEELCNKNKSKLLHIKDVDFTTPCGEYYFD